MRAKTVAAAAMVFVVVSSGLAVGVLADDIPHENYDLVGSNLDFVISLLRSSIDYSEGALMAMYNQTMADVDANLTIVSGVLIPAERLLGEIKDVAESYGNLSYLLPPFADLSTQMSSFASMEVSLIGARDTIISASHLQNLSGSELVDALAAISNVNSLMVSMNNTIDDMLVSANSIISLLVNGNSTFTDNQLIRLIEKLRELLYLIDIEINAIIHNEIPWSRTEPFLLLWLSSTQYYLGESIAGGGYVYFNGAFASDHIVQIEMDGGNLTSAYTSGDGRYSFSYATPVDSTWLGLHSVRATTDTPNGPLNSSAIAISIVLMPTTLKLVISKSVIAPPESVTVTATLTDVKGVMLASAPCHLILDGENITFATDSSGGFERSWTGFELDYGSHSMQAFYEGVLPYASSASGIVSVEVNIPTTVQVSILSDRAYIGYFLVVNGTLTSNSSTPLVGFEITLMIDGNAIANLTTDSEGKFRMSVPTERMALGGHTLTAAFLHREYIWRYSEDSVSFTVYASKQGKYPFFPSIPGWGNLGPPGSFTYLFIGTNAYYFWLLVLLLVGISVRVLQTRNSRKKAFARAQSEMLVSIEKTAEAPSIPLPTLEDFTRDIAEQEGRPSTPNERIIWYYQRLIALLTRRDSLSLRDSMTHWEVARTLKTFGYPSGSVDGATILFEKALYSGDTMTDTDTIQMSSTLTSLLGSKRTVV